LVLGFVSSGQIQMHTKGLLAFGGFDAFDWAWVSLVIGLH
jgi:hypothetical protein